jgi:hypothetical protein
VGSLKKSAPNYTLVPGPVRGPLKVIIADIATALPNVFFARRRIPSVSVGPSQMETRSMTNSIYKFGPPVQSSVFLGGPNISFWRPRVIWCTTNIAKPISRTGAPTIAITVIKSSMKSITWRSPLLPNSKRAMAAANPKARPQARIKYNTFDGVGVATHISQKRLRNSQSLNVSPAKVRYQAS